ncbi:MAG: hypothetical protein JXA46_19000 [Dehalococcoidales bacterium]|nr:hypothetical protein [Dehalococcoidales bacterium]
MAITVVNLILASIVLVLGIWAYFKRKSDLALSRMKKSGPPATARALAIPSVSFFIGIAFGLYAVSHALTLVGLAEELEAFVISIRIIAYLLVAIGPLRILLRR